MDKRQIAQHFARGAEAYDQVTPVQGAMGERLLDLVRERRPNSDLRQIVELGCGTGRLTAALAAAYPLATITAVDLAPAMLAAAQARLGQSPRLRWLAADAEALLAHDGDWRHADLLIANATIQWFDHPIASMVRARAAQRPGALLAFSTFGPATFMELRQSFAAAAASLGQPPTPRTLALPDLAAWRAALPAGPGQPVHLSEATRPGTYPSLREFLHQVRAAGASLPAGPRLTPSLWRAVQAHYAAHWAVPGGVQASYHPIWVCCG